jgi:hypothetical protein
MQAQTRDRSPAILRIKAGQPPALPASMEWADGGTFARTSAPASLIEFAAVALAREGFEVDGILTLVRHRAGDRGLPVISAAGGAGFAIDLTDARRTLDGGLLLFAETDGALTGWRAETGALTLWTGEGPDLTELAPGSPDRLTLIGAARPL